MTMFPAFTDFLPHGEEMILLDEILSVDKETVRARAVVGKPLLPGFNEDPVSPLLALELIAQSAAAFSLLGDSCLLPIEPSSFGVVASFRDVDIATRSLSLGQNLLVEVEREDENQLSAAFNARVIDIDTEALVLKAGLRIAKLSSSTLESSYA